MKIAQNCVVALSYELEVEGAIADKASEDSPLEYIQGMGMLIPRFEQEVAGKEPGEDFEFTLSPAEGYGEYNAEYVVSIPKEAFAIDGKVQEQLLVVGRTIPMYNAQGQVVQGSVKEVKADSVDMDFNHPMAGKTLHFTGKVVSVREATEKELTEGLHGEFAGCGGGCGHCGGGCKEGGCEGDGCQGGCEEGECKGGCCGK